MSDLTREIEREIDTLAADRVYAQVGVVDIFGKTITKADALRCVRCAAERIIKLCEYNDDTWDTFCRKSLAEVEEADHPKHSVLNSIDILTRKKK